MITLALTGIIVGLVATVASLAKDRNRYHDISNETIKELALLEKDRDYWRDMAVEMTDKYIYESGVLDDFVDPTEEDISNPFAVEHIEGCTVSAVTYVRDEDGNIRATNIEYERN